MDKTWPNPPEGDARFNCWQCGSEEWLQYMVTNEVWKEYGIGKGVLCIPCLELRMQRPLTLSDFKLDTRIMEMMRLTGKILGIPEEVLGRADLKVFTQWWAGRGEGGQSGSHRYWGKAL